MLKTREEYAIAVDIGGTNLRIAKVTRSYEYELLVLQKTPQEDKSEIIEIILRVVEQCKKELRLAPSGIGISAAGPVDPKAGIFFPPNLPYDEISLVFPLQDRAGTLVSLLNDCRAGVLGERYAGAGLIKQTDNMLYITFSTGIGVGAICNGHLVLGSRGNAGEMGHIPVRTRYTCRCSCGVFGHFEAYASGFGLPRFFVQFCEQNSTPHAFVSNAKEIFDRAIQRDPIAMKFLDEVASIIAYGLSTVVVAYDPSLIVVEGPIMRENPWFLEICLSKMEPYFTYVPDIVLSSLNGYAPLLGSIVPVFEPSSVI
ncbi:MAG: ROK family protein [Methanomicrobiales archaeon]|jgi:glucokinase|nr:ROK family protein [Methanomicrobiales archaeon]